MHHVAVYLNDVAGEARVAGFRRDIEVMAQIKGWDIVATYEDKGVSTQNPADRSPPPALQRLLKDAGKGTFDMLVTPDSRTLGASFEDFHHVSSNLFAHGVGIHFSRMIGVSPTFLPRRRGAAYQP